LFPILRSEVVTYRKPGRLIINGSASPDLIRDSSESLACSFAYKELCPFHYLEIVSAYDQVQHWIFGSFPEALLATSTKKTFSWHSNFIKTFIEKDLIALGPNINPMLSYKFWQLLASQHGKVMEVSSVS
jgi:predicted AAA+ superfamily ATPase